MYCRPCLLVLSSLFLTLVAEAATQVSLISYTYTNSVLAGAIKVQNIAYAKTVSVYWGVGSTFSATPIAASYTSGPDGTGYEVWSFSGTAAGATQFYIMYTVAGTSYYDPGNNVNYQITATSTSPVTSTRITSTASRCVVTRTTTVFT